MGALATGESSATASVGSTSRLHQSRDSENEREDGDGDAGAAVQAEGDKGDDSSGLAFPVNLRPDGGGKDEKLHGDKCQVRPVH